MGLNSTQWPTFTQGASRMARAMCEDTGRLKKHTNKEASMKVKITRGKFEGINACADSRGVIAALAVDHRGNLLDAIARARGKHGQATAKDMLAFKTAISRVLSPSSLAILLYQYYGMC